jgi:subtilisin family serine protease
MNKIFFVLTLSLLIFSTKSFASTNNSKLSPTTKQFIIEYNKYTNKNFERTKIFNIGSKIVVVNNAKTKFYIKIDANYSATEIEKIGGKEIMKTKSVALISLPISNINKLAELNSIEKIEIDTPPEPSLDRAIPATNVDKVHSGTDILYANYGKGVIVGVVDYGFDFTHPMLSDKNGNSRVKRAWLSADITGVPPGTSEYGSLYTDSSIIKNVIRYSSKAHWHATHVTGIAAGSEVEGNRTYTGAASEADIAVVELGGGATGYLGASGLSIVEALEYLFSYADSVGKPIVVNMSLGSTSAPCDGLGISDVMLSEMLNEHSKGKILVTSAGNNGGTKLHMEHQFIDTNNNETTAFINVAYNSTDQIKMASLAIWGNKNDSFEVNLQLYDADLKFHNLINDVNTSIDTTYMEFVDLMFDNEQRIYEIYVTTSPSDGLRDRPYIYIYLYDLTPVILQTPANPNLIEFLQFKIMSDTAHIHCWNLQSYQQIYSEEADANFTIGSPGIISEVITAASYNTRDSIISAYSGNATLYNAGSVENISNFSSRGPRADGTIKPDITAPGSSIYSAYNSFDSTSNDGFYYTYTTDFIEQSHRIIAASGTSMSSPMVTGIVALMLNYNPELTQTEIKDILKITAINDNWTGNVRDNKSATWGWGKIDALQIMKEIQGLGIDEKSNDFEFLVFPNPIQDGILNISIPDNYDTTYIMSIYNQAGKMVYLSTITDSKQFNIPNLSAGTYLINIRNLTKSSTKQIVIAK